MAAVFTDDDGNRCGRAASGKPIAPTDDEAGVVAERTTRKIILTATAGNRGAKLSHGRRASERVKPSENPDAQEQPSIGQLLGDIARRVDDACSDRIPYGGCHPKPHAKDFQQAATAVGLRG